VARFVAARLLRAAILVVCLTILVFLVTHVVGDPVRRSLPLDATQHEYEVHRHALGLDKPLLTQFRTYMTGALHLDFGTSFSTGQPAMALVRQRVPRTFILLNAGMAFGAVLGIPLGVALGFTKRRWFDRAGNGASLVFLSLPSFWIGIMLILFFAVHLRWLPSAGMGGWKHLVLPGITLGLHTAGRMTQITEATLRDELDKPYIRTATAKGMSRPRVIRHAVRNILAPVTTIFAYEVVKSLAGYQIIVEAVFAFPGLGLLVTDAAKNLDLPLTAASAVTIGLLVVIANTVVDLLHRGLDPRVAAAA
jgi:peptide/nickel transport system permease protein